MRLSSAVSAAGCSISEAVRVRFAPSPTGQLHIGGLRTALFNYLFAKKHGGSFVLRVEDTDRTRFVENAQDKIYEALHSYKLYPDEGPREGGAYGPYEQSKRLGFYHEAVDQLIETGHAYRCFCSEERLDLLRKDATRRGDIPKYDRRCAHLDASTAKAMATDGKPHVIRFKLDKQDVHFKDEVFGDVTQHIDESDAVLLKSDGYPTYHLANIVDDKRMDISHVIRGMEWLSSTGKHRILYSAFGWSPPKFLHLSLIMKSATKKLSKRDKDAYVAYYGEKLGVLPDAVLNLLVRNGSGIQDFDDNHFYPLDEMVSQFDASLLGRRNLLLDADVLNKYARMAFVEADFDSVLRPQIIARLRKDLNIGDNELPETEYLRKIVSFLRDKEERFGALSSLTRGDFQWFFTRPNSAGLLTSSNSHNELLNMLEDVQNLGSWSVDELQSVAKKHTIPMPKLLGIVRVSLIGTKKGPPISELVDFFGIPECNERIETMKSILEKGNASHKSEYS